MEKVFGISLLAWAVLLPPVLSYTIKEVKIDFTKPFETFTVQDLAKYDGTNDDKPIYMAIKGTVFDVTSGKSLTEDQLKSLDRVYEGTYLSKYKVVGYMDYLVNEQKKGFYGRGSAYNALVGKDAGRAVAKMSLEPEDLTNNLEGLTEDQLKSLDRVYEGTYLSKYKVVGYMDYLVNEQKKGQTNDEL